MRKNPVKLLTKHFLSGNDLVNVRHHFFLPCLHTLKSLAKTFVSGLNRLVLGFKLSLQRRDLDMQRLIILSCLGPKLTTKPESHVLIMVPVTSQFGHFPLLLNKINDNLLNIRKLVANSIELGVRGILLCMRSLKILNQNITDAHKGC